MQLSDVPGALAGWAMCSVGLGVLILVLIGFKRCLNFVFYG